MSKTQITLAIAILIAVGNAVVPFLSVQVASIVTVALGALATIFHTSDVKTAVAKATGTH